MKKKQRNFKKINTKNQRDKETIEIETENKRYCLF